jgi:hypothetical protein
MAQFVEAGWRRPGCSGVTHLPAPVTTHRLCDLKDEVRPVYNLFPLT